MIHWHHVNVHALFSLIFDGLKLWLHLDAVKTATGRRTPVGVVRIIPEPNTKLIKAIHIVGGICVIICQAGIILRIT